MKNKEQHYTTEYGEVSAQELKKQPEVNWESIEVVNKHWNQRVDRLESLAREAIEKNKDNKIRKTARFILRRARDAMLLAAMSITLTYANYERTRWTVTQEGGKNSIVYKHQDKKTTDILNYLAGSEKLSEEMEKELSRAELMILLNRWEDVDFPEDLQKRTDSEFREYVIEILKTKVTESPDMIRFYIEKLNNGKEWFKYFIKNKLPQNQNLYQALWHIQQRCGNPKICWINDPKWVNEHGFRAHYDPLSNTMFISPVNFFDYSGNQTYGTIDDWLEESAHGKQFQDNPLELFSAFKDIFKTLGRSMTLGKSVNESQNLLYDEPGTIEHEAHTIIGPELKKEFYPIARGEKEPPKKKG